MLYDKILVAIDGSDQSNHALSEAIRVAKFTGAAMTLVHVNSVRTSGYIISAAEQLGQILEENGKAALEEAKKMVAAECDGPVDALLLEGDAADRIVETAHNGGYDLIVIGPRGLSKLSGLILGSVSQGVIKNSPCPVLLVK